MATHAYVHADRRVNLFMAEVSVTVSFHRAKKSLAFGRTGLRTQRRSLLQTLGLGVVSILQLDESLSNLEEITVRFIRSKLSVKHSVLSSWDFSAGRVDSEGVLHHLAALRVHNF